MSKLTIRFNEMDPQTNEISEVVESFDCVLEDNIIKYQDNNSTNHEITIKDNELLISSNGEYKVTNHYIQNHDTEMSLVLKEGAQAYKLQISTSLLEISNNDQEINIELKYTLFDDEGAISNHHIYMGVKK